MHFLPSFLTPHGSSLAASAISSGWGLGIGLVAFILLVLALVVLLIVSEWKMYVKAGKPGWASLVPFYNSVVRLEITGKPLWWIVLFFIPVLNLFLFVIVTRRLAAVFGKGAWFTVGLIFLPFIFYPILAFGSAQYANTFPPAAPMSDAVKWSLIAMLTFAIIEMPLIASFEQGASSSQESLKALADPTGGYASGYSADGSHVYYDDVEVIGADPKSFRILGGYGADDTAVYYGGVAVPDADPATFVSVNTDDDIGKDAAHVFCYGLLASDADPATFMALQYGYSKDASHVYYASADGLIPIKGADSATFVIGPNTTTAYDAQDSTGEYLNGERIAAKK